MNLKYNVMSTYGRESCDEGSSLDGCPFSEQPPWSHLMQRFFELTQ